MCLFDSFFGGSNSEYHVLTLLKIQIETSEFQIGIGYDRFQKRSFQSIVINCYFQILSQIIAFFTTVNASGEKSASLN